MPEEDARVTDQGDGSDAEKGGKGKEPSPLEAEMVALRKDLAAKDKRIGELGESERYWSQRAQAQAAPKAEEPPDDQEEAIIEDSADSAVDAFSTHGIKALRARGLVTKKDAKAMFAKEAKRLLDEIDNLKRQRKNDIADADMAGKYPELDDDKSPLFLRTRQIFQEQVSADPGLQKSPGALMMAARTAKAELKAEAKAEAAGSNEADRQDRIRGQGGGNGRRPASDVEDNTLSPVQKGVINRFNAEGGVQIKEEDYVKRARAGVRMSMRAAMPETAEKGERREVGDW